MNRLIRGEYHDRLVRKRICVFLLYCRIRAAIITPIVMSKWWYAKLKRTLGGSMHHLRSKTFELSRCYLSQRQRI
ncbi:MAG: hypothetical protein IKU25_06970 [Clostridia bacterium]|nr:hypothetical protein [Clostridia bacterium]